MKPLTEYRPDDFLNAEELVTYLIRNREIQFQATGDTMDRETAMRNFTERQALVTTKRLLIDEGERLLKAT